MSHWELSKTIFRRYGKNGLLMGLFQVLTVAVQLIVVPFLARVLPQAEFGILQFSQTLLTWFAIFSVGNSTFGAKRGMISGKEGTMWHVYLYRMRFMVLLFFACALAAMVLFLIGKPYLPQVCVIVGLFFLFGYLPQVSFPQIFIAKNHFGWFVFWQSLALVVSQGLSLWLRF
jgi:O-antigen/teichoic acid export membrane protein